MKVQELLMNIHNKEFDLEKGLQVKKYLPIEAKKAIAQAIIYESVTEEDGVVKVDSVQRYLSYVKYMITYHTNLEYTGDDYDILCSTECDYSSLLNAIIECFGEDAKECSRILNLMMDDKMQESSMEFIVARFLNDLNSSIGIALEAINNKINDIDLRSMLPEDVDMNKLNAFLSKYVK